MNILDKIAETGIPNNSPIQAVRHMREYGWMDRTSDDYKFHIVDMSGVDAPTDDERVLNYTFRYLVTTAIENPEMANAEVVRQAHNKAQHFVDTHQYVFAAPEDDGTPKLDAAGNPKPKKGAKKEMARKVFDAQIKGVDGMTRKAAIEILVAEVGLTPAGASTYYANLKKGVM